MMKWQRAGASLSVDRPCMTSGRHLESPLTLSTATPSGLSFDVMYDWPGSAPGRAFHVEALEEPAATLEIYMNLLFRIGDSSLKLGIDFHDDVILVELSGR